MSSNKYGDKSIEFDIIEEGKKVIKEGYLPIHADFMTGELVIPKKVWLTIEEAKAIHEMLYSYVWEYAFCLTDYDVKLPDDLLSRIKQVDSDFNGEYLHFYEERIEQAEGKCSSE